MTKLYLNLKSSLRKKCTHKSFLKIEVHSGTIGFVPIPPANS